MVRVGDHPIPATEVELDTVNVVAVGNLGEDRQAMREDFRDRRIEAAGPLLWRRIPSRRLCLRIKRDAPFGMGATEVGEPLGVIVPILGIHPIVGTHGDGALPASLGW